MVKKRKASGVVPGSWKAVDIPLEAMFGMEDASGFGGLEELTDYDDTWLAKLRGSVPEPPAAPAAPAAKKQKQAPHAPQALATATPVAPTNLPAAQLVQLDRATAAA